MLTLGYLLSLNPAYSLEGALLILVAVGMTQVIVLAPRTFKAIPFVYLFGGFLELILDLRGPWWTLINTLAVAGGLAAVGSLLQQGEGRPQEPRRG